MHTLVLRGLLLAALAALLVTVSGPLALESVWPLLAASAIAFVPGGSLPGRVGAFGAGLIAAWVGFALRAAVLPDIPSGRAVFVAVPVVLVTVVAVATRDRVPLWAGLAGAATFGAAYHPVFVASPTDFAAQSVATMTSVLLASAIGGAAAMLLRPAAAPVNDSPELVDGENPNDVPGVTA